MTVNNFLLQLDESGYFKYTDQKNLQAIKECLLHNLTKEKEFMTAFNFDGPFQADAMDLRFYNCGDCEELFEEGGVINLLDKMNSLFTKIGLTIKYSDDNYDDFKHTIKLNKRKYELADDSPLGWGETFEKYARMINKELELQKSDERIYLYSHDSGEYMVFLTERQYEIVSKYIDNNRPLKVDEWIEKILQRFNHLLVRYSVLQYSASCLIWMGCGNKVFLSCGNT